MNVRAMVDRLNDFDQRLCGEFGIPRPCDASTLDEAIAMSAATTENVLSSEDRGSWARQRVLALFLQAQVEARAMKARDRADVVRSLTGGIRRMKHAESLQRLARVARDVLRDDLGFDNALLSFVENGGFVVEESEHGLGGPTVIPRRDCRAELDCIRLRDTVRADESDVPATPGYRELLFATRYLVAPVIARSRVVALLHVSRGRDGLSGQDGDVLDAFASAYSLLYERLLNSERLHQQRTSIARAAARLTDEANRIAAAAINLDDGEDYRTESPSTIADSTLVASLSDRERQVFEMLVLGASNADIADELVIAVETVKTHVKRILRKIGAINRAEAIALYMEETGKGSRRRGRSS